MDVIERGGTARRPYRRGRAADPVERYRLFTTELAEVRVAVSAELNEAVQQLRADARARLVHPDRQYPAALVAAVTELDRRYVCRADDLTYRVAARALAGYDTAVPPFAIAWTPPVIATPHRGRRRTAELIMMAALTVGLLLLRLPWMAGTLPSPLVCGVTVSVGLALAWWMAASRRANAAEDALTRWTEEVLRDAQNNVQSALSGRQLDVQRQMRETLLMLAESR
jgi:hypothetical protein